MTAPEPVIVPWEFRRQTLVASQALLRIMRQVVTTYGDDLEATVIYLAITCANVNAALADPGLAASPPPAGPMPERYYRGVSRRAIAASTGLPRETVRRKIATFIERGELVTDGAKVRIPGGLLEQPRHFEFAKLLIQEFTRAGARLAAPASMRSRLGA